jgi:hypothetical protein
VDAGLCRRRPCDVGRDDCGNDASERGAHGCEAPTTSQARTETAKTLGLDGRACCSQVKFGAGEGIRTLDPNLGKVVLYP